MDVDTYLVNMMAIIDKAGWAVQGVFPTNEDPGPWFSYTVGLTAKELPELLIMGLPSDTACLVLNDAAAQMIKSGVFEVNKPYDGIINYDVQFIEANTDRLGVARRLYSNVSALQLVYPDRDGRFPWDDGYSMSPKQQPLEKR